MTSAPLSARARVRAELRAEIQGAASAALAQEGAAGLSLRGVARELGMAPSALYRYFASRDDLLTALIVDAYNSLADAMEAAAERATDELGGWTEASRTMRRWAFQRPHEWALLYGSPVPGYHAPQRTVPAALRVPSVFSSLAERALAAGRLGAGSDPRPSAEACASVRPVIEGLPTTLPLDVVVGVLAAWEQLAGAISLELFGHFDGGLGDADAVFDHVVAATAARNGLAPAVP